jgi:CubicO group peptidase (beta-lactamase class C family)
MLVEYVGYFQGGNSFWRVRKRQFGAHLFKTWISAFVYTVKTMRTFVFLVILLTTASSGVTARFSIQLVTSGSDPIVECLQRILSPNKFSGTVLIAKEQVVLVNQAYGTGITTDTRFYIASISKQFVAAALLKLQERHRLNVDDEISKYFSNVPQDKTHITIHMLLTHTSGLPQVYAADGIADREKAIRAVLAEPLKSAPGTQFGYTNDGYSLLAALVEVAAAEPFETFVRREILDPAGLDQTGFWGDPSVRGGEIAPMLRPIDVTPNWGFRGATGMYSTVRDLYRWTQKLLNHQILSKGSTDQMLKPYVTTSAGEYGYGWFNSKTNRGVTDLWTAGYEDFGHNGIIHVYGTGVVSVVLTNSGDIAGAPARALASDAIEKTLVDGLSCDSKVARRVMVGPPDRNARTSQPAFAWPLP